jgi:ubiquinone/menaquinone biosynthesis C-methylase UbiE
MVEEMLPVNRPKEEAQRYYDRLSKIYDWLTASERALIEKGVVTLAPARGETILEIGCGTGTGLAPIAAGLDETGKLIGLDLAFKMLLEAQEKTRSSQPNITLLQGDGTMLPLRDDNFDAVYCAYTLELFQKAERFALLNEIQRVLSPQGRLVVLSLSRAPHNLAVRLYELGHRLFPVALDCRPIPLGDILQQAGFAIQQAIKVMNWGLPVDIILAHPG